MIIKKLKYVKMVRRYVVELEVKGVVREVELKSRSKETLIRVCGQEN